MTQDIPCRLESILSKVWIRSFCKKAQRIEGVFPVKSGSVSTANDLLRSDPSFRTKGNASMLVGVCCECQEGGKFLRYDRGKAIIDSHDAFGSFCQGSGQIPQATYQDSSGSDQMPEGVQVVIGNGLPIVKDRIQEDQFEREEQEREQAKEAEKFVCCFDPWCNHRPDPPKPAGMFGTIGDLLAAKNGKQKTKKRG